MYDGRYCVISAIIYHLGLLDWEAQDVGDFVEGICLCRYHSFVPMCFKVTCYDVILIFYVWRRKQIHTCLSIPNYHHWNYFAWYSPLYRVLKSWVQVDQNCAHQFQHRYCVEEIKQFNRQLPPKWVAKSRGWDLIPVIENFHLIPTLGVWLSYFGVFLWHYCRQYCIKQINQYKIKWPSHCQNKLWY